MAAEPGFRGGYPIVAKSPEAPRQIRSLANESRPVWPVWSTKKEYLSSKTENAQLSAIQTLALNRPKNTCYRSCRSVQYLLS
jgi:hypothetical protein